MSDSASRNAAIAHELRAPLGALAASLDLLEIDAPELGETLARMRRQIGQLERLAGDLLEAPRLAGRRFSVKPEAAALQELVFDALDQVRPVLGEKRGSHEVLVVEDDALLAESLARLLSRRGHRVELAHTGAEALRAVGRRRPDLVLLDLSLPDADGLVLGRRIRSVLGRPPLLVATTGRALDSDRIRAEQAGFDAHLLKPVSLERIEGLLRDPALRTGLDRTA